MTEKDDMTLSEKITSLIQVKPTHVESDDDLVTVEQFARKDNSDEDSELEIGKFRKLNIEFLDAEDKKYVGRKSSRLELTDDAFGDDSSEIESTDGDTKSNTTGPIEEEHDDTEEEEDFESDVEEEDTESEEEEDAENEDLDSDIEEEDAENEESVLESDIEDETVNKKMSQISNFSSRIADDIVKGKAIQNQLAMWDKLLELRIKFQKCLMSANQLPNHNKFELFKHSGGAEFGGLLSENKKSLTTLLSSLLDLQQVTLNANNHFSESKNVEKSNSDNEITSDSDENIQEKTVKPTAQKRKNIENYSNEIGERHNKFQKFRDATIQKWNDKTRIGQMNSKNFNAFEQSTLKQIEYVLNDKQRLIKKTQIKRSNYHIIGEEETTTPCSPAKQMKMEDTKTEQNTEIFDDNDFYHQLLRELLERKATDVTDPVQLSRQWIQLQKARSKMKRNVDTKASKGRKVRFLVHSKLVNFMMPIEDDIPSEVSRQELFNSLFGKKS